MQSNSVLGRQTNLKNGGTISRQPLRGTTLLEPYLPQAARTDMVTDPRHLACLLMPTSVFRTTQSSGIANARVMAPTRSKRL